MELDIREIRDRGGKEERLFIKVLQDCNLNDFIVYDETLDEEGNKSNIWKSRKVNTYLYEYIKERTERVHWMMTRQFAIICTGALMMKFLSLTNQVILFIW